MLGLLAKFIGSANERQLKRIGKIVKAINAEEQTLTLLSDEKLRAKTDYFKQRLKKGETLKQMLPEAFAVVREASHRVLGMRHFDVQMIGGITLHEGRIAEMRTGEGKTLVATLPVYLNALTGKGVHVVTVNDYLASRDANWMRPLYEFLGLSVGIISTNQNPEDKAKAYNSDVTYGTNNEFGFDYLRDNMAFSVEEKFQRELNFVIVDEVDSILIDEARTPLIISGPSDDSSELYRRMNLLVAKLTRAEKNEAGELIKPGDYTYDEKTRQVEFTEEGHQFVEKLLQEEGLLDSEESLYAASNLILLHHMYAALKAHAIYHKNIDYIVKGQQIILVDEHTGRTMQGRRLSEGLHQALEAKEGVEIQPESQTLASTTFQNYFRLYDSLSGMTGTADTEAYEFQQIYGLDVIVIPTHRPTQRKDYNDLVYMSLEEKYQAIIKDIKETVGRGQPILVGTASIESSELLSNALQKAKVEHQVLNAKFHEKEALIIAQAGKPGAITIATNMAGRGTDIVLGGNWEFGIDINELTETQIEAKKAEWKKSHDAVLASGGLHIIGTERHESRRIDNQLRGRAGRQGDPGASRFYLSLEDSLMRIFASDTVKNCMKFLGMEKGEAIESRVVSNAIEKAQRKVEGRNFDIRKQLLEYDDVANDQRHVVYAQRNEIMAKENLSDLVDSLRTEVIGKLVDTYIPPNTLVEQWEIASLETALKEDFSEELPIQSWVDEDEQIDEFLIKEKILEAVSQAYKSKEDQTGSEMLRTFEKHIILKSLDDHWKEHLASMDHLRQGIHLRGYAAKNPKQEYKREAFELFQTMLGNIKHEAIKVLCQVQIQPQSEVELERQRQQEQQAIASKMQFQHQSVAAMETEQEGDVIEPVQTAKAETFVRQERKVGRNEICPCGSGKKYKHCHGKL